MYTISSNNTLYCIDTHILTRSLTIPVTSTPLEAKFSMVWRSPFSAASHISLFSSYNNVNWYIISYSHRHIYMYFKMMDHFIVSYKVVWHTLHKASTLDHGCKETTDKRGDKLYYTTWSFYRMFNCDHYRVLYSNDGIYNSVVNILYQGL